MQYQPLGSKFKKYAYPIFEKSFILFKQGITSRFFKLILPY